MDKIIIRQIEFDETLANLRKITLMSDQEIMNFVQSNVISYHGLKEFYLKKGRLPNPNECFCVIKGLIDLL